jgi:hypothetical protein
MESDDEALGLVAAIAFDKELKRHVYAMRAVYQGG